MRVGGGPFVAAIAAALGCGAPEARTAPEATGPGGAPGATAAVVVPAVAPGPRLGDGASPLAYDLTLELDPDQERFMGRVAITIAVAAPGTAELWLHAVDLEIARARVQIGDRVEEVGLLASPAAPQQRGFRLPRLVAGGERVTLMLDFTGHATDQSGPQVEDQQGLFRQPHNGRWYLYSQAESIFARRIVPCFDEPRWKPAWRVTAIVPASQVALGNAPIASERALPDGRREVRFAELAAVPSYLLAVAVGPFDVVDAGRLGRGHVPVRLAVPRGDARRLDRALHVLPRIVAAVEDYVDRPLPLAKLDVVAVPTFFGAMENPGLITIQASALLGDSELVPDLAHELVHQWFGNAVTPAWWDQLWLSEAFATWLGTQIAVAIEGAPAPALARHDRARLREADAAVDAAAMVHPIAGDDEVEPAFDAIVYSKGAAVLAMFEHWVGATAFRAAARSYLAAHAGRSVTSEAWFDALARATSPAVSAALASNVLHAGTPVVAVAIACGAPSSSIVAEARDGVTLPVCVRYPARPGAAATTTACLLAGAHSELALPASAGCPAWLVGNAGGHGYYRTAWRTGARLAPLAALSPEERAARADDVASAASRGELAIADALAELGALAASDDAEDAWSALAIADAIDPLVGAPAQPAWRAWLAHRFARRLAPGTLLAARGGRALDLEHLLGLVGPAIDPAAIARARGLLAQDPASYRDPLVVQIAAAGDDSPALFDRIVASAAARRTDPNDEQDDEPTTALARLPGRYAARIVALLFGHRLAAADVWPAVAAQLQRGESRDLAWRAVHARFAQVVGAVAGQPLADVIGATAALCTPGARAELVADLAPVRAAVPGRSQGARAADRALARTLATIDRCIARRAAIGDIAAALSRAGQRP